MTQHCFFIAVQYPLASAASSTPPQLPLGHKKPRNKKPWGKQLQGKTPAGKRGIIDAAPASLEGQNPKRQRRASLGGRNPGDKRRASLGGQNPRDNNNNNAQPSRVWSNDKELPLGDKTMGTK